MLIVVLLLPSCARTTDWAGLIEERDGVVHVENPTDGVWSRLESPLLSFELEQVFGADQEPATAILGDPYSLVADIDSRGNLYVLDGQQNRVVSFAPNGGVRWVAGGEGEGPGELQYADGLDVNRDGQTLFIVNQDGSRIERWDLEGNYIDSTNVAELAFGEPSANWPSIVGFADAETMIVTTSVSGLIANYIAVVHVGDPWEVGSEFIVNQLPGFEMAPRVASTADVVTIGREILVGSKVGYSLRIFDLDGRMTRMVTRPVDFPTRPGFYNYVEEGRVGIGSFGSIAAPMVLPDGRWLVDARWEKNVDDPDATVKRRADLRRAQRTSGGNPSAARIERELARSFDLFDPDGRFLASEVDEGPMTWWDPPIGSIVLLDGWHLYTLAEDPFPQFRRYRLAINER